MYLRGKEAIVLSPHLSLEAQKQERQHSRAEEACLISSRESNPSFLYLSSCWGYIETLNRSVPTYIGEDNL